MTTEQLVLYIVFSLFTFYYVVTELFNVGEEWYNLSG